MKQIAPDQNYILLIAPVRKGRSQQSVAEGKTFPLLIVLICLYLEKQEEELSLVQDVYKIQAVAGYNWYNTARPELRISSAMFEGLETDGIITLMNTATMELEDWQARIFGVHDGVREIKGEIEKHIGSKQDYGSEIGRIMFQYDRNEKEKDAGKAEFEAAPWDKQIAEAPCSWVEVPSLRSVVTTAAAVYSAVVTTVATTALSVASFGTLSAPMAALCAAGIGAAITLSAEATFAVADVAGGYKDWDEVGKDLAISAATSVISAVGGAAGAAIKGIGGIGGALLKTGVSMSTSATSTVATKAIQYAGDWDGFASSMASFDTRSGVITSGAGSLVTNSLNLATIGDNGVKVTGFSSLNVNDMQSLNSVVGGLASSGLEYGLTGKTTLNVLNIADIGINSLVNRAIGNTAAPQVKASCGLLELHLDDSQGASFALGTGGTDLSIGTVASAARGFDALKTNFEINHYTNKNDLQNAAIALRTQYGFGGKTEKDQLKQILSGKTELKAGSGPENAQTVRENGKRIVYLNGYSNDMTREEQLKLGITLGHEAYRDGVKGDELTQKIETRNAVAGHTDMMTRMLGDSMYAGTLSSIIAGDRNLQLDLIASSLGDDVFNDYVDNCYDSSADYWRMTWGGQLINDGQGWLVDENGMYINIDGTRSPVPVNGQTLGAGTFDEKGNPKKGSIETGLLNIIAGTSGQEYSSFSNEEIKAAQALMTGADTPMKPLNPDANFRDFKWSQYSLGQKIDMTSFMETAGANVNQEIFKTYYNNTVDSQISKMLGLDLGFDTGKEIPKNQYGNYVSMLGSRLSDYFSTGNAKQALTEKYFQTIVNENGESTKFYKLDKNNPFLDKLKGQHDITGINYATLNSDGCNFMSSLAVPQLLTGIVLSENEIKSIWDDSLRTKFKSYDGSNNFLSIVEQNGTVNDPDKLTNIFWKKNGYSDFTNRFTSVYKTDEYFVGTRIVSVRRF